MSRTDSVQLGVEYSERLIRTVGRAFYSDSIVVLLDLLLNEKFIIEKEIPFRLHLREKETSRLISQLQKERLIHVEDIDGVKHLYIDYRAFVNVVRYRVHIMQKTLKERDDKNINFKCPTCSTVYNALEVQHLKSKDAKFICSFCCPSQGDFRLVVSEPRFTLVGADVENDARTMERKMNTQLSKSSYDEPYRDGIFELLKDLKPCQLIHNRPSDNISRGIGPGIIADEELSAELEELHRNKRVRVEVPTPLDASASRGSALGGAEADGDGDIAWEDS